MATVVENPFTMVWDGLWELAEANTVLTSLIRIGNRIKFEEQDELKRAISDGDLPELSLLSAGAEINLKANSSATEVTKKYTWGVASGELQINAYYNRIAWELLVAMVNWCEVLGELVWPVEEGSISECGGPCYFVKNCNIIGVEEGTLISNENRGIRGWAGMWNLEVQMMFRTSDLIAYLKGEL